MTSNVKNVYAAEPLVVGSLLVAPLGTAMPADAVTALATTYVDLGYVGDTGFVKKLDRRTTLKRCFGGKVVKVLQSEFTSTIQFKLLESLNADCLKAAYGTNNVQIIPATASHGTQVIVKVNAIKLPHLTYCVDTWDDELNAKYRIYIPDAQVTTVGDIKVVHTDTIEYDLTMTAFDDLSGEQMYVLTDDGVLSSGSLEAPPPGAESGS